MAIALLIWIAFGVTAASVASGRGANGCLWFGIGVLFGPFALLFAYSVGSPCPACRRNISAQATTCPHCGTELAEGNESAPETKQCPFCAETILAAAKKCRYCGEFLPPEQISTIKALEMERGTAEGDLEDTSANSSTKWAYARTTNWIAIILVGGLLLIPLTIAIFSRLDNTVKPLTRSTGEGALSAFIEAKLQLARDFPERSKDFEAVGLLDSSVGVFELGGGRYRVKIALDGYSHSCEGNSLGMKCGVDGPLLQ